MVQGLLIAAAAVFLIDALLSKSIQSAGLTLLAAAMAFGA